MHASGAVLPAAGETKEAKVTQMAGPADIINNLILLGIGCTTAASAYFAYKASLSAKSANETAKNTEANVQKIEVATNSMKDALVKATHDAALLQGQKDERAVGDLRRSAEAKGRAEATEAALQKVVVAATGTGIAEGPVEGEVSKGKLIVEEKK